MWLVAVSAALLPVVFIISKCYRVKVLTLFRRARAWTVWLVKGRVCTKSTHAFVFSKATHGRADSVLNTYDLYNRLYPSLSISPQIGSELDEIVRQVRPALTLELGMHCGYSSLRMLRLLPPGGKLIAVEVDPIIAEYGEEVLLVAGYKHHQFQVLNSSSEEAIPSLSGYFQEGFNLVLMDHDPDLYLTDLQSLEKESLLCPHSCSIILIYRDRRADKDLMEYIQEKQQYFINMDSGSIVEVCYRNPDLAIQ